MSLSDDRDIIMEHMHMRVSENTLIHIVHEATEYEQKIFDVKF